MTTLLRSTAPVRRLVDVTAACLCLGVVLGEPALAASRHKTHRADKHHRVGKRHHHAKKGGHRRGGSSKAGTAVLTEATARTTALASATPLKLSGADEVRVTGCTSVAGPGFSCDLELHAAASTSICHWSVVVQMTRGVPDVVGYSHIDCGG